MVTTYETVQKALMECDKAITKEIRQRVRDKVRINELRQEHFSLTKKLANTPFAVEVKKDSKSPHQDAKVADMKSNTKEALVAAGKFTQ